MNSDQEARLRRLMLFRVVMVTTLLFIATYVEAVSETLVAVNPVYFVILGTYALTLAYAAALRLVPGWLTAQVYVQLVGDMLTTTALVYVNPGGVRTGFLLLYPLAVLSSTFLLPRRAVLALAGLATVLYGGLLLGVRGGLVTPLGLVEMRDVPARAAIYSMFVMGVACSTVALLGSYLNESLRNAGRMLRHAAVEVADLRELNQQIVDSIQSGLLTTDEEGLVLHLNAFARELLGQPLEALRGRPLSAVLTTPLLGSVELQVRASSRTLARLEVSYAHPARGLLDLGVSVHPLAAAANDRVGYLVVFQDLTDVRRLEREVRTKEKLAAVGEMAAQLAHEIRNPLGSIRGSAQVLMAEPAIGEEQGRLLAIISRESKRLSETLNRFLYQARQPSLPRDPVDLRPLLESAVTLLRNGSEVRPEHAISFDADAGPHVCLAAADQISQVFWNLARNALEAMPEGGRLDVSLRRVGESVVMAVRDQGRGLGADVQKRLFEPIRGGSRLGEGLGLAIVFGIVRQHGGDIAVRSHPEQGTEIDVSLPALAIRTGDAKSIGSAAARGEA
jgi:two-component system sensor histidine kinase PilS (NtrC family)